MKKKEDYISGYESDNISISIINKEILLILSSVADTLSIHTHIKRLEYFNKIISENSESSEEELKELNDSIDLCKTTSKLSPNKINELVYEALVPGITNEISINSELNQQYEHISEEYNQIDKEN